MPRVRFDERANAVNLVGPLALAASLLDLVERSRDHDQERRPAGFDAHITKPADELALAAACAQTASGGT